MRREDLDLYYQKYDEKFHQALREGNTQKARQTIKDWRTESANKSNNKERRAVSHIYGEAI